MSSLQVFPYFPLSQDIKDNLESKRKEYCVSYIVKDTVIFLF